MSETNGQDRSLSTQLAERGIEPAAWHTLSKNLYPGAQQASILMVIDYCKTRGLDPLHKPCHIVPMKVGDEWRDVVMPGIYEYRTTAHRTGEYLGHAEPVYGEDVDHSIGVTAPEWCRFTVYRWNPAAKVRGEYPVTVYFSEVCGTKWDKDQGRHMANGRWLKAPRQMLTKCAEAAALREAFPEELGGEHTFEEMADQGAVIDVTPEPIATEADDLNAELGLA